MKILHLAGTAETREIARPLALAGYNVLVSTATDEPLDLGAQNITRRTGALSEEQLFRLLADKKFVAVVDSTHPYAQEISHQAFKICQRLNLPYFTYRRAVTTISYDKVVWANDHSEAAMLAASFNRPILLTIGSKNIAPYVEMARKKGLKIIARVLPRQESQETCLGAGLKQEDIITAKGPFSVEENLSLLRKYQIGCMVSKDSGQAGGVPAKIEAAKKAGAYVVMVRRPDKPEGIRFLNPDDLVEKLKNLIG